MRRFGHQRYPVIQLLFCILVIDQCAIYANRTVPQLSLNEKACFSFFNRSHFMPLNFKLWKIPDSPYQEIFANHQFKRIPIIPISFDTFPHPGS